MKDDYVSFEIAKLLKEKGFDMPCDNFYDSSGKTPNESVYGEVNIETLDYNADPFVNSGFPKFKTFSAPTLQMAMKWLREKHNIHIIIDCDICDSFDFYSIIRIKSEESWKTYVEYEDEGSNTYEEALEKAIEYCLTKLI